MQLDAVLAAAEHPAIAGLDLSMFTPADLLNLVLQRSEVIGDRPQPGRAIKAWTQGDAAPLHGIVADLGDAIARRAFAAIWLDYQGLAPRLARRAPRRLADIGCGYAGFDLFAQRDLDCALILIDIETTAARHFGFSETGAGYTSLATARQFLTANGVPDDAITTLNPGRDDIAGLREIDLAVSFISCGFHYPWQTYRNLFENGLSYRGVAIFDQRQRAAGPALQELATLGPVEILGPSADGKAQRVQLTRTR